MNFLTCLPQSLVLNHDSKGTLLFHVQYCINIDPCQKNLKLQQQLLDFNYQIAYIGSNISWS